MTSRIRFCDTTFAARTPDFSGGDRRVFQNFVRTIAASGVDTVCAGNVAAHGGVHAIVAVAAMNLTCEAAAVAPCTVADVNAAIDAIHGVARPVLRVVAPVSRVWWQHNRADTYRAVECCVRHARRRVDVVELEIEDATSADRLFLRQCVAAAVDAGATRIAVPDAAGAMSPADYAALVADVVAFVGPGVHVGARSGGTREQAVAAMVAAVNAGAAQVDCVTGPDVTGAAPYAAVREGVMRRAHCGTYRRAEVVLL